ncbi:putative neutral ceramidase superfamily lipid hydrolase [Catalinimonas alkaloidigena]|nr:putative neutral ceramidase superfamily lipid hydrolase [Catalinimonas alkaloidigena]
MGEFYLYKHVKIVTQSPGNARVQQLFKKKLFRKKGINLLKRSYYLASISLIVINYLYNFTILNAPIIRIKLR